MNRRWSSLLAWLPAALYMGAIWLLSSMPLKVDLRPVPFRDKGVHFVVYGGLSVLLSLALHGTLTRGRFRATAFYGILCTVLWGLLDEIHQAYVPGRSSDAMDAVADALGAVVGTLVFLAAAYLRSESGARSNNYS